MQVKFLSIKHLLDRNVIFLFLFKTIWHLLLSLSLEKSKQKNQSGNYKSGLRFRDPVKPHLIPCSIASWTKKDLHKLFFYSRLDPQKRFWGCSSFWSRTDHTHSIDYQTIYPIAAEFILLLPWMLRGLKNMLFAV